MVSFSDPGATILQALQLYREGGHTAQQLRVLEHLGQWQAGNRFHGGWLVAAFTGFQKLQLLPGVSTAPQLLPTVTCTLHCGGSSLLSWGP